MRLIKYTDRQIVIPTQLGLAGKYRVQVYRPDGRCRRDTGWFENLITDTGLDHMGITSSYMRYVSVGSGTAAPQVADTGLASFVAATDNIETGTTAAQSTAPYYTTFTRRWRFGAGAAAGNLSEVGVGTNNTGTSLFSRSLITDGAGSPTTITVLADEFLDVTYQVQCIPPTSDTTASVTDSGPANTVYDLTIRASKVTTPDTSRGGGWQPPMGSPVALETSFGFGVQAFSNTIGTIVDGPALGGDDGSGVTTDAYVGGSHERTGQGFFGLGAVNTTINTFVSVWTGGGGGWQAGLSPALTKTDTDTLTVGVKTSWTRTTAL